MKVLFVSLGCDKNTVDSEKILKRFVSRYSCELVLKPEDADIVMINTCSFVRDAKDESIEYIKYFIRLKKEKKIKKVLAFGCLIAENNVTHEYDDLLKEVDCTLSFDMYMSFLNAYDGRVKDILSFSSSIKICDGCDKYCSYCIIPYLRGHFKSQTPKKVLSEVKKLAKDGVRELSIVGQDILNYGYDIKNDSFFKNKKPGIKPIVQLINEISNVDGIEWIRLLYCYPEEIDDSVINLIKDNDKVLPYIDMPIQHISDRILKLMNRKTDRKSVISTINKLRENIPNICIRTTLIVGFPGETDSDFKELIDFVKDIRFDKLGVFTYSREKLSRSYNYDNQVPENIKLKRKKKLLDIQKSIVKEKNEEKIGYVYNSIVEGRDTTKKDTYIVRPYFDARGIDDKVYVKSKDVILSGSFVNVEIKKALAYDLVGELI